MKAGKKPELPRQVRDQAGAWSREEGAGVMMTDDQVRWHLVQFIDSFIKPSSRARYHSLIARQTKNGLEKLLRQLRDHIFWDRDEHYTEELNPRLDCNPELIARLEQLGATSTYISVSNGTISPRTLDQLLEYIDAPNTEGILSFLPGRLAIYVGEAGLFLCSR